MSFSSFLPIFRSPTISSAFTPPTANLVARYDANLGVTQSGGAVSDWADQSGNGYTLSQAVNGNKPTISGSGTDTFINFDGSNDYLQASLTLTQPYTIYIVLRPNTWGSTKYITSGDAGDSRACILQYSSTPNITLYDGGGTLTLNADLTVNGISKVLCAVFDGASSSTLINNSSRVTFNPGAGVGGSTFFRLGSNGNNTAATNISVQEIYIYSAAHSTTVQDQMYAYLHGRWFPTPLALTGTYLAADSNLTALSQDKKDAVDRLLRDLSGTSNPNYSTSNVLSKIMVMYPFPTGISAADRINLVTPGTYNATETGSPTWSTTTKSAAFNGSSNYLNTNFTPNGESTTFNNSDFTCFGIHRVDTNADTNATVGEVGGGNSFFYCAGGVSGPGFIVCSLSGNTAISASKPYPTNSWYMNVWNSTSLTGSYVNGTNINSVSNTWGNTPTRSAYIGAYQAGSAGYGGPSTVDFYISGKNTWSNAEVLLIYNAMKAFKKAVGITWT